MGGLDAETPNCCTLASKLGLVVVNVDYRLAPEHKYPTAVNDCWDVLQWVCDTVLCSVISKLHH